MKVLVTGASGFVGGHICDYLLTRGHSVTALSRSGKAQAGVIAVKGDVTTGEGLSFALSGAGAVIHLVGIIKERPPQVTFEKVHVEGTRQVLQAAEGAGVRRYLQMSALGANEGASRYFDSKARAEALVKASGLDWTVFRPSLIFGVGDDFFGHVLKGLVQSGPVVPQIGDGHFPFRPVWIGDVARAFEQSLSRPVTLGKSYDLVGPVEYSLAELLKLMKRALGVKKPVVPVPLTLMRLSLPALQLLPNPPITHDQFKMLLAGNTGDPREAGEVFDLEMRRLEEELPKILASGA
ncbi:MAG: complex I NDUFA9 subunit family protein [Deinococcota bacterium]|nr:complex I NDUFA9 subunit family protein [Deinococcota bacterium]